MKIRIVSFAVLLTIGIFLAGCAGSTQKNLSPQIAAKPFCQKNFAQEFKEVGAYQAGRLLTAAEQEGCWEQAMTAALESDSVLPEEQLVRALEYYNRNQTRQAFDQTAKHYLKALVDAEVVFEENQRRFLEAYSREAIRSARSQKSPQLRLVQQVCWRLDRAMYARLFE